MDAEVFGNLDQRDTSITIQRDSDNIIAELFGKWGGHRFILPDQRAASQIKCHLFVQQALIARCVYVRRRRQLVQKWQRSSHWLRPLVVGQSRNQRRYTRASLLRSL